MFLASDLSLTPSDFRAVKMSIRTRAEAPGLNPAATAGRAQQQHENSRKQSGRLKNTVKTESKKMIYLSDFPQCEEGKWSGFPIGAVVVAATLHRTYKVHTDPSMVVFHQGGEFCSVELSSCEDMRSVLRQVKNGTFPTLHHRDEAVSDWVLKVDRDAPSPARNGGRVSSETQSSETSIEAPCLDKKGRAGQGSTIQLSGLPGAFNREWEGVRMTEVVVASMIHRTYGVRTSPELVTFNDDRTHCLIDLQVKCSYPCLLRTVFVRLNHTITILITLILDTSLQTSPSECSPSFGVAWLLCFTIATTGQTTTTTPPRFPSLSVVILRCQLAAPLRYRQPLWAIPLQLPEL
jgi:hypothetical protein